MKSIYNTYKIDEYMQELAQSRLEDWGEFYDEKPTLEQINEDLYTDDWAYQDFYEMQAENLAENYNTEGYFVITGSSIGWRNLSGTKSFYSNSIEEFISEVVGLDCDYSLELEVDKKGHLSGRISHHDSPTGEGREIYTLDEFIKLVTDNYSIKQLRMFLSNYKKICQYSTGDIMDYTSPKNRARYISQLSRGEIRYIISKMFEFETSDFVATEANELGEIIEYYLNNEEG